ncbi:helix-turn-helix domain-containing protein [uncultured Desulfovibrio sp.]|uniref:helix-turn-helix domain-containing protein n=1 Tax=uncultured Desulfovibrio sp. TaxID=167968 RepID=UPI00262AC06F|nr:helix-turn-helix domain-containing protein [uncultured Desulfovibrio sp.]
MVEKAEWPLIGMTLEEAADALRVNPRTVQDLILRGNLPARKVGVGWRIDPDAVKAWLATGNAKAEATDDNQ